MTLHNGEHWASYNDEQTEREPRALFRQLLALARAGDRRQAVDLGCGSGIETRALLEAGWRVHAVDDAPGTPRRVLEMTEGTDRSRLTIDVTDFHALVALPAADMVYSGYSLPYVRHVIARAPR